MQRKAIRATVGGIDVDIPIGALATGEVLTLVAGALTSRQLRLGINPADQDSVSTTFVDITNCSFACKANTKYFFGVVGGWSAVTAVATLGLFLVYSGTTTSSRQGGWVGTSPTTVADIKSATFAAGAAGVTYSIATFGNHVTNAAGNLSMQFQRNAGAGTVRIQSGTCMFLLELP